MSIIPTSEISKIISIIQKNELKANKPFLEKLAKKRNTHDDILKIGALCLQNNRIQDALIIFNILANSPSNDVRVFYNLGLIYQTLNRNHEALDAYDKALKILPDDIETLINKCSLLNDLHDSIAALKIANHVITLKPQIPQAWLNKGLAQISLHQLNDGINSYHQALRLDNKYCEAWTNLAVAYFLQGKLQESLEACDTSISINPNNAEAHLNKATILIEIKQYKKSIAELDQVLALSPNNYKALSNKGLALTQLRQFDAAINCLDSAINLNPNHPNSWFNKGLLLSEVSKYDESIICFQKLFSLEPNIDWADGELIHTKMKICLWEDDFDKQIESLKNKILVGQKVISPFALLPIIDDPKLHKDCSEIFIKTTVNSYTESINVINKNKKIKVGYFSADFHNHATSYLMAEFFELHNKNDFEIYAFSYGPNNLDEFQKRLKCAFNQFIDVSNSTNFEILELCQELNIDIAVDLKGYTQDARIELFSLRLAPIQIQYLGYPGTLAADYYDYVVADKIVISDINREFFTEKVIYLPNCYQVNDSKKIIPDKKFLREELGLPIDGFVFCCFNNNYKITPIIFDSWMRILENVPNSVLWLYEDNDFVSKNIKTEASKRNIDPNRIIFAKKMSLSDHLSRYYLADLFLDTFPYNAHTTASDALWCGLPLITISGNSFASRVARSLLRATNLEDDLATLSFEEYETLAINLAKNPEKLSFIRSQLISNRFKCRLFDTSLFTKYVEDAYKKVISNKKLGLPNVDVFIN